MARSKRPITLPEGPQRPPVRRRTTENPPPENVTGDLNEPPPLSGEPTVTIPDAASSQQASPTAVSSSKAADTSSTPFDDDAMQAEEEERRLEEEYLMKMSAIKKRKEDAERRRREEEEKRREEEERIKKEEEERVRKEEEERVRKEEEERIKKEEEEKIRKQKEDEERIEKERKEQEKREIEEKRQAEEARLREEEKRRNEEKEKTKEQIQTVMEASQANPEPTQPSAHSGEDTRTLRSQRTTTRSDATRRTPVKKPARKTSAKGKGIELSLSNSSFEPDDNPVLTENPYKSTVGTAHAPSGIPRQFTSSGAAEHYACIASQKLGLERGFDPDFVEANSFVKTRIEAQDWSVIATANRRANASLVREFYAEASQVKEPIVTVRGKLVNYTPSEINRVLGRPRTEVCAFAQFLKKMTIGDEAKILKEIAVDGKKWGQDGQRRCLAAGSLTTEAAIWFQFIRSAVSPTSHDTTLSMHKCALLYCVLTGRRINLGIVMNAAIQQAKARKKVILPLPCLITALLTDAGVPTSADDQWMTSSSNISVLTVKKMGRSIQGPSEEPQEEQPRVFIAEEHQVGIEQPTVGKAQSPQHHATAGPSHAPTTTTAEGTMAEILEALKKINYRLDLMEAEQRYQGRATNSFWMYTRERDEVMGQFLNETNPLLAAQLPSFPEGICATYDSEEDDEAASSSPATPTH